MMKRWIVQLNSINFHIETNITPENYKNRQNWAGGVVFLLLKLLFYKLFGMN